MLIVQNFKKLKIIFFNFSMKHRRTNETPDKHKKSNFVPKRRNVLKISVSIINKLNNTLKKEFWKKDENWWSMRVI